MYVGGSIISHQPKHIVVIGAGIGGLSAAIHLAARGHQVQVLERQPQIGGKLNQIIKDGFAFDTGPSLITMPYVLADLFQAAGRNIENYLNLLPLDITCRYFYHDGAILNAWRDHHKLAEEFIHFDPGAGQALQHFMAHTERIYQAAADPFLYSSLGGPLQVMGKLVHYVLQGHLHRGWARPRRGGSGEDTGMGPLGRPGVVGLVPQQSTRATQTFLPLISTSLAPTVGLSNPYYRLQAVLAALSPQTLDQCVHSFFKDEHLRQLFDRYATYNGSSPYQVASVYSIIPYIELASGGWYLKGGIYTLAQALGRLAQELGVCVETDCNVQRILVERREARGVVLADGRVERCDAVIANSDVVTTHRDLLSPAVRTERMVRHLESLEPSCSGFVLMLGVNKRYPQLSHHNIFFSADYRAEFDDLFVRHLPQRNPTIYICMTSHSDPSQAPAGHENLFVLVNAPYLTEASDWQRDAPAYRERVLDLLASYPQADLADLREHIVCEELLTPTDFWHKYGSNRGSIYGLSSNTRMAPFTRPGNHSSIRNLYFVGGSTHPGGGVPLVTLSGKIVSELVEGDM